jgi:hypothetical protein
MSSAFYLAGSLITRWKNTKTDTRDYYDVMLNIIIIAFLCSSKSNQFCCNFASVETKATLSWKRIVRKARLH